MYNSILFYSFEGDMLEQSMRAKCWEKIKNEQNKGNDGFRRKAIQRQESP